MWEKESPNHSAEELDDLAEAVFQEMLEKDDLPLDVEYWVYRLKAANIEEYNHSDLQEVSAGVWERFRTNGIELFRYGSEPMEKLYGIGPHTDFTFDQSAAVARCPGCGSSNTARIIYGRGMPTEEEIHAWPGGDLAAEWKQKAEEGKLVFRKGKAKKKPYNGRLIRISPERICNQCRKRFKNSSLFIFEDGSVADYREMVQEIRFIIGGFHQGHKEIVISKTESGARVRQTDFPGGTEIGPEKMGPYKWKDLMDRLYCRIDLQDWNREYTDPDVQDGEQWELSVRLSNGTIAEYCGSNKYPPAMLDLICALRDCAGFKFRLGKGVRARFSEQRNV